MQVLSESSTCIHPPQAPATPISTEPLSSPKPRLQPQLPPQTNVGIRNPLSSLTDCVEEQESSEERRKISFSSSHNQAVELNVVRPSLNYRETTQEDRTKFALRTKVAAQDKGHSYFYFTIIVSALILVCLDLFALIFLLPAFYFAHKVRVFTLEQDIIVFCVII